MTKWYTKEEYKINLLYAFPSYRCLLKELDSKEREINKLNKNIKYYERKEIKQNLIKKQKNRTIFRLRKELKELKKDEEFFRLQ